MVTFSIFKEYKIQDLVKEEEIKKLLPEIKIDENEVTLDIKSCFIDYPVTGMLLDKFLEELAKRSGKKKLTIIYDYHHTEIELLACLFDECVFFGSMNFKERPLEEIKKEIQKKLFENSIYIELIVQKFSGNEQKVFRYGN